MDEYVHSGLQGIANSGRLCGLCYGCGQKHESYSFSADSRLCTKARCLHEHWPQDRKEKLVTILPEWSHKVDINLLPCLYSGYDNSPLATWADMETDRPVGIKEEDVNATGDNKWRQMLPYEHDHLADYHMRCGQAMCYRSKRLQTWVSHPNIFVLDMSSYAWSQTLKDPRSWAILNVAIENNKRHLAAWTAGNAGYSLTAIARVYNHHVPFDKRMRVYALYDRNEISMDEYVKSIMARWECELLPVPSIKKRILPPIEIQEMVKNRASGIYNKWDNNAYWDVTDGWDVVGMIMYRLLCIQVLRDICPTHVIAPIGTGNLVLGLLQSVEDLQTANRLRHKIKITGTMPHGDNIVKAIADVREGGAKYLRVPQKGNIPVMPKIAGTYTPLLPCIDMALGSNKMTYMEATLEQQINASQHLKSPAHGRRIISEPSSVSSFAVLPHVVAEQCDCNKDEKLLILNTGCGVLSDVEITLMKSTW